MNLDEIQTMLGLAFLENHPRLEVMQNLVRIASKLEKTQLQSAILNTAQRIYIPDTAKISLETQDEISLSLLEFCEHCHNNSFSSLETQSFRNILEMSEKIMLSLEDAWRNKQSSVASKAANTALDWLTEALIGRNLSTAELAVLRRYSLRRQHIRSK